MANLSLFDLSGQKALVTGGAMGIGYACATALAMGGADVAIIDLNEDMGNWAAESIRAMGCDAFFIQCDVSDKQQVQSMMDAVVTKFGRLDVAVNNAGIGGSYAPDEEQDDTNWDKVSSVCLKGVWLCATAQAQQMIKQTPSGGKIINTASIAGFDAHSDGVYSASKAGVINMTRALAVRWGRFNINVNCFSPGFTMSPMLAATTKEAREEVRTRTPLGHLLRPRDFRGPILFLASDASNVITGQNLVIDAGLMLTAFSGSGFGLDKPPRVPPRISPDEELEDMKQELDAMGIAYDDDGVRVS
jgi:NAD(P)-dependent dehydrogenase (short-subunit alcohol dehydrogenase family)